MKKFISVLLVYCVIFTAVPSAFCALVDPYNVMHPLSIRDNGVSPNKNYIKMTYILKNPEKFDAYMFGSSRVGSIHTENIQGERCYNMTYSNGLPEEHLNNIKTFIKNGIVPKKIYIGIDSLSYTNDSHENMLGYRLPYEYLTENRLAFFKNYLDPAIVGSAAIQVISKNKKPADDRYAEIFYEYGWNYEYGHKSKFDFSNPEPTIGKIMCLNETLDDIAEIVKICNENELELVVFVNPMCKVTYEASLEKDYFVFLRKLADITPYYNFSGLNDVATDYGNFYDTSHYSCDVGDMILDCICNGEYDEKLYEQGFGWYVTHENADEFIALLESQQ